MGDAAADAGDQGGDGLGQQDVAGVEVVAGDARALGHVDAADDGQDGEGDGDRQVLKGPGEAVDEAQRRDGEAEVELAGAAGRRCRRSSPAGPRM